MAEHLRHEIGEAVGDPLDAEALLPGRERESVARQGWRDDGERIGRVAAEPCRVGQARNDVEELEDRAGPAMGEQQRHRRGPHARHMHEVQLDSRQLRGELREGVQPRLRRAPVEARLPAREQPAQGRDARAEGPGIRSGRHIRQPRAHQARLQVKECGLGHGEGEGSDSGAWHAEEISPAESRRYGASQHRERNDPGRLCKPCDVISRSGA
jgi:hypothetical protein